MPSNSHVFLSVHKPPLQPERFQPLPHSADGQGRWRQVLQDACPGVTDKEPSQSLPWSCAFAFSFERMSVHAPKRKKGKRPEFSAALSQGRTEPDNLYSGRKSSGGSGQETVTGPNSDKDCEGRTGSRVGTGTSGPGSRRRALGEQDVGSGSRGRPGGDVGRGGRWA